MSRYQRGHIYQAFGAFHVRFYQTDRRDGHLACVQKPHRLCFKDRTQLFRTCGGKLADVVLVNFDQPASPLPLNTGFKPLPITVQADLKRQHCNTLFLPNEVQTGPYFFLTRDKCRYRTSRSLRESWKLFRARWCETHLQKVVARTLSHRFPAGLQ
jgi:hypothetical protein